MLLVPQHISGHDDAMITVGFNGIIHICYPGFFYSV